MEYQVKNINELKVWDKNPRDILEPDFERLKLLIQKLGLFKPFITTEEGIVLGGNMRLKACLELNIKQVPVSIVKADTDKEKLEYALADNDRAGYYLQEKLKEIIINTPDIDIKLFSTDLGMVQPLDYLVNPDVEINEDGEWEGMPEVGDKKAFDVFRSIIIHFDNQDNVNNFAELINQQITDKTKYLYYPKKEKETNKALSFTTENEP